MFSIELWENLATADRWVADLTPQFKRWQHSTRAIGGNWQAEGEYQSAPGDMKRFFLENMARRIRVTSGGLCWWEGQIVNMEYTHKGQTWTRSMEKMANWAKVIYSKVGDNLFTNGDVESGAWTQVGTPSTHETSTSWYSRGATSMHVVTDAASEGTEIQASVAIVASTAYTCTVIANVVSGAWTLNILEAGTATVIASRASTGTGYENLTCQIPDSNTETSVDVQLVAAGASQEAYFDGAVLRTAPVRSETKWWPDSNSVTSFGRIEAALLEREMTDDEADGKARKHLTERAWIRTKPERRGSALALDEIDPDRDRLIVNCLGLVWTLDWRHALTEGTDQADNHVNALLDESEFVVSTNASVQANAAEVYLDSSNPTTLWDQLQKCLDVGDGAGNSWYGGLYPGRVFMFWPRPSGTQWESYGGAIRAYGGGSVPPLEFLPHWCWMADMPVMPAPAGGDASEDDPRRVWLEETWFIYDGGKVKLKWTYEEDREQ